MPTENEDACEIAAIVQRMFDAISWSPEQAPDFPAFRASVRDDAVLIPSARPAKTTDMTNFLIGMKTQRDNGNLVDFEETALGTHVRVFGNIAVAIGGYESMANKGKPGRGANVFLLVRGDKGWEIAAMAWDNEKDGVMLPADLAS
jgi:hypothetical protein